MARILMVEDDARTVQLVTELLSVSGHEVASTPLGREGLAMLERSAFDLVILDVNLPDRDGLSLCSEIRQQSAVPILILSARGGPDDRVDGLHLGADDYLPKPFDPRELLARIEAIGRRSSDWTDAGGRELAVGDLMLDPEQRRVRRGERIIDLTSAEFEILRVLMERAGRVVSRERLSVLARGQDWGAYDRVLDVHVSRIRKKLGDDSRDPNFIRTVRGVGYVLAGPG